MKALSGAAIAAFGVMLTHGVAVAQSADAFYRDHNLTIIVGTEPGGGYGVYSRLLARYMAPLIAGDPDIVVQYMPGASGRRAAEYLYANAPQDGTVFGTIEQNIPFTQVVSREPVRFDIRKFNYLGNLASTVSTVVVWNTTGVRTIEDATKKELMIGATGVSGTTKVFATLLNEVVGTRFRVVTGYPGGNDINLAMERGEVDGRASYAWSSLKSGRPEWLRDNKISILVQIGLHKSPDLPEVPLLLDLAHNSAERDVVRLYSSGLELGRVFLAPPNVPPERVAVLRAAFHTAAADPHFRAEAQRLDIDIEPMSGEKVAAIISELTTIPPDVVARARKYLD
jgi:tripartite-type tricarboxylate transporter receptor subunit TctC